MQKQPQLTQTQTLRERARQHIHQGAVTEGYGADRKAVLGMLNDAVCTPARWPVRR